MLQSCKKTLRHIAPLLTADKTAAMLKEHLIDNGCLQFPQFAANLVKIMVHHYFALLDKNSHLNILMVQNHKHRIIIITSKNHN